MIYVKQREKKKKYSWKESYALPASEATIVVLFVVILMYIGGKTSVESVICAMLNNVNVFKHSTLT